MCDRSVERQTSEGPVLVRHPGLGKTSGHATTPAGGESGGRPHGRLGGEESGRVSTVANDP